MCIGLYTRLRYAIAEFNGDRRQFVLQFFRYTLVNVADYSHIVLRSASPDLTQRRVGVSVPVRRAVCVYVRRALLYAINIVLASVLRLKNNITFTTINRSANRRFL